jgi:HSP20 family protein
MRDFVALRDAMDRLFEDSYVQPGWNNLSRRSNGEGAAWRLPLDVYTTAEEVVISANVPGVNPESVAITFEGDVLTIKGDLPAPLENVEYVMRERRYGPFSRSLTFNVPVNADSIEATFEHGVLTVVVPKAEAIKPKQIKVLAR